MMNLPNMIDNEFEIIIHDMGFAPVVAAMTEVLGIPEAVNQFVGAAGPLKKVDTGTAIKALIINVLYGRTPLVHVQESFKHLDCEVLFGKGLQATDFNDDCLGKSIETIGRHDFHKLFSELCMRGFEYHEAIAQKIHADGTNISVFGEYDSPPAKDFEVTYGDPKSKRKDLKQLNIGLFVQQTGLPIGGNALSGNKTDTVWFKEAIEELSQTFSGDLNTKPICIFDAAASNEEMFKKANRLSVPTIIRLSDRFKMAEEHISKAWEEDQWILVNKNGERLDKEPAKDLYKLKSYDIFEDEYPWRLTVVYSSQLKNLKEATAKRNYPKLVEKTKKEFNKIAKKKFESIEKANEVMTGFIQTKLKKTPFEYEIKIEESTHEKYTKRGKPSKKSEKTTVVEYQIKLDIGKRDEALYTKWLQQESCFVLVSNIPKDRCSEEEILGNYKDQWVIEEQFKFLKQPVVLGPIWLQNQDRIKGLIFVLLLAVLVNMYICYRCIVSLQRNTEGEANSDVLESNSSTDNEKSQIEVKNSSTKPKNKILTSDGRLIERPTFKVIKKLLTPIKTIVKFDAEGSTVRKFPYATPVRLLEIVILIGFDPSIYLEKFTFKMDLWKYK